MQVRVQIQIRNHVMMISGQIQNQIQRDFHPGADLAPGLHPDPNSDSNAEMQIDETAKQRERGAYRRNRDKEREPERQRIGSKGVNGNSARVQVRVTE